MKRLDFLKRIGSGLIGMTLAEKAAKGLERETAKAVAAPPAVIPTTVEDTSYVSNGVSGIGGLRHRKMRESDFRKNVTVLF